MVPGRRVVAAVAAAVTLQAMMADADCFDYCYKNCIANDRSMADYCNYACDKTCAPGSLRPRPLAVGGGLLPVRCQIDCVRRSCTGFRKDRRGVVACYRGCFDGCKARTVPTRPLRAGSGADAGSSPASVLDHSFHEKHDDVRPAAVPDHPFHEKQGAVEPVSTPDHP